ncbi:hypothetical protein BD414DRAFT_420338, partial [Trametes punicea]
PWHLTVIRVRGLLSLRPEKSWRPIVKISVVNDGHEYILPEVLLGCDGQNSNFKSFTPIHGVNASTSLIIQVFHKSHTKKKRRKPVLVGSGSLSLSELFSQHPLPHLRPVHHDVRLSCSPSQRKSPSVGSRHQHTAMLTLKLVAPCPTPASRPASRLSNRFSVTDEASSDGASSSKGLTDTLIASGTDDPVHTVPSEQEVSFDPLSGASGLRRRRKKIKPFRLDSDGDGCESESSYEGPWTPTFSEADIHHPKESLYDDVAHDTGEETCSPCVIPLHNDGASVVSMQNTLSFAESIVDRFTPYHELCEADLDNDVEKAEKVLGRLLTEWYVVGASLLALAGIDAAVFGFAPGAMFVVDGFSQSVVAIGAIAAGIGLVSDAWFLVLYSGANTVKFQRLAKDVYNSYFFFCLTCRLPTMCMFISALALMLFLLGVAWTAWPAAVLVMSFAAGLLVTSQFLIYGVHRFVELIIWVVRVSWRRLATRFQSPEPAPQPHHHLRVQPQPHLGHLTDPPRASPGRDRIIVTPESAKE